MTKDLSIGEEFKNKEGVERYIIDKIKNGWIIADFLGDRTDNGTGEPYFHFLATQFYGDKVCKGDGLNHRDDMEIIEDTRPKVSNVLGFPIPTIDLTKVVLIKKNELLHMIIGGDIATNNKLLYVNFFAGGCAEGMTMKDDNDIELYNDLVKDIMRRFMDKEIVK